MLNHNVHWRLLALLVAVPWLAARAQTLPNDGFPDARAAADHAHHDHFFQQLRADARVSSGFLIECGLPLADLTRFGITAPQRATATYGTSNRAVPDSTVTTSPADTADFDFAATFGLPALAADSGTANRGLPALQPMGVADLSVWHRAYATLLTAGVGAAGAWLPPLRTINERLDAATPDILLGPSGHRTTLVPLLALGADYQRLAPDALSSGQVTFAPDSQLVASPTGPGPFRTYSVFVAAPGREVVHEATVRFVYSPANCFIRDPSAAPSQLLVNFGDGGGWHHLVGDTVVVVQYPAQAAVRRLGFQWIRPGRPTLYTAGQLVIDLPAGVARPASASYDQHREYHFPRADTQFSYSEPGFPNPDATYGPFPYAQPGVILSPPGGQSPIWSVGNATEMPEDGATVTVALGGNHSFNSQTGLPEFRKPLIVIEGYDGYKFSGGSDSNYSFDSFLRDDPRAIQATLFENDSNGAPVYFADKLADNEFDLIFVDFEDGTGDLRKNAMIVANVIEWVKAHYAPGIVPAGGAPDDAHKITVMGQSMGGLIGRFALAYLDRGAGGHGPHPGVTAWVKRLITRDSPHRGAVTPLALQIATHRLAQLSLWRLALIINSPAGAWGGFLQLEDVVPPLRLAHQQLEEPASRQLNLRQDIYTPGEDANDFRDGIYRSLTSYQHAYEFVALSNGSECGTPQPFPVYQEIAKIHAQYRPNPLLLLPGAAVALGVEGLVSGHLTFSSVGDRAGLNEALTGGIIAGVCLFTGSDFSAHASLRTLPDPTWGSQKILDVVAHIRKRIRISPVPWVPGIPINIRLFKLEENSPAGMPSYEQAPGGYYLTEVQHREQSSVNPPGMLNWTVKPFIDNTTHVEILTRFCFVPTASAIDKPYTGLHVPLTQTDLYQPYTDDDPATTATKSRAAHFIAQEPTQSLPANTRHIAFTTRNAKFIFGLINSQTLVAPSCQALCGQIPPSEIDGPVNICAGGAVYSVPAIAGVLYDWNVSLELRIVESGTNRYSSSDPSANVIHVQRVAGPVVAATIILDMQSDCRSFQRLTKNVSALDVPQIVRAPDSDVNEDYHVACHYEQYVVTPPEVIGAGSYDWTHYVTFHRLDGTLLRQQTLTGATNSPTLPAPLTIHPQVANTYAVYHLTLTAHSNCTAATVTRTFDSQHLDAKKYIPAGSGCKGTLVVTGGDSKEGVEVYPNAADEKFLVELLDDTVEVWNDDPAVWAEFKLYDPYGVEKLSQTEPDKDAEIPTKNLPDGPYILRIWCGDRCEMRRILVQH